VWHLTRTQDHHVAELLGRRQVWVSGDWPGRFGLDADPSNSGYGHSTEQVAAVRPVTLGVRLVSVANDDLQHVGQAAYVRGLQ
jgi:hypothetical protein